MVLPAEEFLPATLPMLAALRDEPAAQPWLAALPSLIEEVRAYFGLRLSPPLPGGTCSWVAPAELPDGTPAIVKIGWPHREMLGEPEALRLWDGRGAARLLAHDRQRHALLLERCEPGQQLARSNGSAESRLRTGCAVLRKLWQVPPPPDGRIEPLAQVAVEWAELAERRMAARRPGYDPGLVAEGVRLLCVLPASAERTVVLHGDFNPTNVLSASRTGWLAIDPKPMVGDPAYDPWPLLEQIDPPLAYPGSGPVLRERLALLAGELALPAERIAAWAVARLVQEALWRADCGDVSGGVSPMAKARVLADLC